MKRLLSSILLMILFVVACFTPGPVATARAESAREFHKGEVVVEIKPEATIEAVNARRGTTTIERIYGTNFYRLRTPKGKKEKKWRKRLASDPDVLSASLNPIITYPSLFARATVSFPDGYAKPGFSAGDFRSQQELFDMLGLEAIGDRSRGAGVVVAIIDTGVDTGHPMIASRLWSDSRAEADLEADGADNDHDGLIDDGRGWDFVDNDNDPSEVPGDPRTTVAGHGTFIAGLISLLAPECRILPVRAFPPDGVTDAFTVAAAVKYAADHGANVINLSLGSPVSLDLLHGAIRDARERGITVVAAVGNDNSEGTAQFPSSLSEVMAVAAIDLSDHKAAFSNFGQHVDVCAPGVRLISAYPGGESFAEWSGTSFAAPLAAASAALVVSADPRAADVKEIIEATAINIDDLNPGLAGKLGRGRIDPLGALRLLNTGERIASDFHAVVDMLRAPAVADATGRASVNVAGDMQDFTLDAQRLRPHASYRLIVDGFEVVSAARATSLGSLRLSFSNNPGRLSLPAPLNPVTGIRQVELRDELGRLVLHGSFSEGDQPPARVLEREARLGSTGALTGAGGRAIAKAEPARESIMILAEGLPAGASFRVSVDGLMIGIFAARSGFVRAHLTSDGSSGLLLPGALRPVVNVRLVEVQDARGQVVLRGEFSPAR